MTLLFCGRWSNIPRYLPRTTRAASLLCILMRTAPAGPADTAAIAAAVSSSSLSLGTSKTLTRGLVGHPTRRHLVHLPDDVSVSCFRCPSLPVLQELQHVLQEEWTGDRCPAKA